jgi:hypothetical protein
MEAQLLERCSGPDINSELEPFVRAIDQRLHSTNKVVAKKSEQHEGVPCGHPL